MLTSDDFDDGGQVCFAVMLALGEMSTKFPSKKGFA
jgi:amino acid permease